MQLRTIRVSVCRSQASFGSPYAHTKQVVIRSPHSWVLNHMQNILDEREMLIILEERTSSFYEIFKGVHDSKKCPEPLP